MKKLLLSLALLLGLSIPAQAGNGNTVLLLFPGVPTGNCAFIMLAIDNATGDLYDCDAGTWNKVGPGAAGGAPTDAEYLVLTLDGTLTAERNFTAGIGIGSTDGGANGAYDIFYDSSELTANQTFWTGASATRTITYSLSGATDPVFNFGNNLFNVTNANMQEGGTNLTKTVSFTSGNCAEFDATGDVVDSGAGCGGGAGDSITINGVGTADVDFDDTDPAAPANGFNVKWQLNAAPAPDSVSAYFDTTTYATTIVGSGSTIVETWNVGASDPVWTVATGVMNLSTGTLQQGGNAVELQSNKDQVSGYAGLDGSSKLTASQGQEVWALADLTDVTSTTGSGTVSVLGTSPTFTTDIDVAVPDAANNVRVQANATTQIQFEGSVADAAETLLQVTNCTDTGADCLVTFPDADSTTVQPDTGAASNFLTAISAIGAISKAQPACSDLSDASATCATAGANVALSNLASVAINLPLLPDAAAADDFGSATLPFKDLFLAGSSGTPGTNNFRITGTSTSGTRVFTLADAASNSVIPDAGAANNFLTAIASTGVISKAQPAFSNISGTTDPDQLGGGTAADDKTLVADSASGATWRAIPNCNTENMLTYTTASNTFGCESDSTGGSPTLDAITAATGTTSINSGDNAIVWNWSLTTAAKNAFTFGENVASVAATDPVLVNIATLAASTAHPLEVTSRGTANGIRVGATDGILVELGTGGVDFGALLNYPTACSATFVRAILDSPTCEAVSLTADVSGILPGANGGTNNAFMQFTGPTTSLKTFTLPDATTTILTTNAAVTIGQGGTGQTAKEAAFDALSPVTTEGDIIFRNATVNTRLARGANGECLTASATTILWGSCGGAVRWDQLTDPTGAMAMNSGTNTELLQFNYTSALGATDVAFQIEQLTGNPLAGSILLELTAADVDILLLSAGGATIDQAGAMAAPSWTGTGSNGEIAFPNSAAAVSDANEGNLRYVSATQALQVSENTAAYDDILLLTKTQSPTNKTFDSTNVVQAGAYAAASIDGDDLLGSSIGGVGLTLTAASPDTLDCDAASTTAVGCPEMAIASEVNTGTSTILAVTPDALAGSELGQVEVQMVLFDFTTAVATGDGAFYFHIASGSKLIGMNLIDAVAAVITVSSSGLPEVDIARCAAVATGNPCSGTVADTLTVNLTIDANEDSSDTATTDITINAAADDAALDVTFRLDVDTAGTGTQGLIVTLIFQKP